MGKPTDPLQAATDEAADRIRDRLADLARALPDAPTRDRAAGRTSFRSGRRTFRARRAAPAELFVPDLAVSEFTSPSTPPRGVFPPVGFGGPPPGA